jgi:hypothetical protein
MVVAAKLHRQATFLAATTCYRSDDGTATPDAYGPACPNGAGGSYGYRANTPAIPLEGGGGFVSSSSSPGDTIGLGGSLTDTDGPILKQALGVWVAGGELSFFGDFSWF